MSRQGERARKKKLFCKKNATKKNCLPGTTWNVKSFSSKLFLEVASMPARIVGVDVVNEGSF